MPVEITKLLEHKDDGQSGDGWVEFSDGLSCFWKVDVDSDIHLIRPRDGTRLNSRHKEQLVGDYLHELGL